jgi:type VI secretion system secreted protein VgrG
MAATEKYPLLSVSTPAGPGAFRLTGFSGKEEMSRLFRYELDLLSDREGVSPRELVGHGITWAVRPAGRAERHFHGVVCHLSAGPREGRNLRSYRAVVVPWPWLLTQTSACRVFERRSVPDIVAALLDGLPYADYALDLRRTYPRRDRRVQYRETTFQFLCRLLEEEGIFYFFHHEPGRHTLILADDPSAYRDCVERHAAYAPGELAPGRVASWDHGYGPSSELIAGSSRCHAFTPGGKFTLQGHDCPEEDRGYALVAVEHWAQVPPFPVPGAGEEYRNTFTCVPDTAAWRPDRLTPRPVVQGPQAAAVAAAGEGVAPDDQGRVRVTFRWGGADADGSCWVDLAESWAGPSAGPVVYPHAGQQVLVDFLEGDPDRPILRPPSSAEGPARQTQPDVIELKVGPSRIRIEPTGIAVEGLVVRIEGQAHTEVRGLVTEVAGDAVLQLNGVSRKGAATTREP